MTLDEALAEAVQGARVTAPHMQPGCYVEHSFSRGFLRCWPVDRPEDEPQRTQCDFRAHEGDEAADWSIVERPVVAPPPPKWGKPVEHVVIDLTGVTTKAQAEALARDAQAKALAAKDAWGRPIVAQPTPGKWGPGT